jgi:hypothetical protein
MTIKNESMKLKMSDDQEKHFIAQINNILSEESAVYMQINKIKDFIAGLEKTMVISGSFQVAIIKIELELIHCLSNIKKEVYDYVFNKTFYKKHSWQNVNYYANSLLSSNSCKQNESISKDEIKKYFNNFFRFNPYSGELFKSWSFRNYASVEMWESFIVGNIGNESFETKQKGANIIISPKAYREIKFKLIKKLIKDIRSKDNDLFRKAFINFPELIRVKEYRIIKDVELLFSDKDFKDEFFKKNHTLFNSRFLKSFETSIYNRDNQLFTAEELTSLINESSVKKDEKIWLKY